MTCYALQKTKKHLQNASTWSPYKIFRCYNSLYFAKVNNVVKLVDWKRIRKGFKTRNLRTATRLVRVTSIIKSYI